MTNQASAAPPALRPWSSEQQSRAPAPVPPTATFSRRDLLRTLGIGAGTLVVAGTGVLGYRVYDTGVLHPGGGDAYEPWQEWRDGPGALGAVGAAILAANPHNTQPWLFEVTDRTVDVFADPTRTMGTVDPFLREQHVGLGCALENLSLACVARGLEPKITLLPDGSDSARVAHLDLVPDAVPRTDPRYDAIGLRHTDRGPYTRQTLPIDALADLVDPSALPGVAVHWITDAAQMTMLGQLLVDAAEAVVNDEQQSIDGFSWFRSNDDAVQQHRDGLTLDAQGLSALILSVAKLMPASSRSAGDTFWVDQTRDVHTRTAAAYGAITAPDADDRTIQMLAGRLLQRIHLTATSQGISLQHMNQITERIDREKVTRVAATFGPRFAELLPPGAQPLVTFRVGYPSRPARPSPRRPVSSVTR